MDRAFKDLDEVLHSEFLSTVLSYCRMYTSERGRWIVSDTVVLYHVSK